MYFNIIVVHYSEVLGYHLIPRLSPHASEKIERKGESLVKFITGEITKVERI